MKQYFGDCEHALFVRLVAFTPKGGCPLKPAERVAIQLLIEDVAFTPKGGC